MGELTARTLASCHLYVERSMGDQYLIIDSGVADYEKLLKVYR